MRTVTIALGLAMLAAPAWAANDGTMTPNAKAAASLSADDFAKTASAAGTFEVESSKLALQRSKNQQVRNFAQMMVTDHTKAAAELKKIRPADVSMALDKTGQTDLDRLRAANSGDFDKTYVAEQTVAHQKAVDLFTGYGNGGEDPSLKSFAQKTLPTLRKHLDAVTKLNAGG